MSSLPRNVQTTKGLELINSAISGNSKIVYTTAELYTTDISTWAYYQIQDMTSSSFDKSLLSGDIKVTDFSNSTITLSAEFLNSNLTNDIAFNSIGWYATTVIDKAQGKDPILMCVSQLDSETHLVAGSDYKNTSFFLPRVVMSMSDAQRIIVKPSEVGFITLPELEEKITELANKGLIDIGKKLAKDSSVMDLHNTSLQYVDQGSVKGLPPSAGTDDQGGYLISLGSGNLKQDGVQVYFNPYTNKMYISYYINKTNKWSVWSEVGEKSYTKDEIDKKLKGVVRSINSKFASDSGDITLSDFEHPDRVYGKNEIFDIDLTTQAGIYKFNDSKVITSMRKDALGSNLPRTTDGTTMCGFLVVRVHDEWNVEQFLLLNVGVEVPDFVIATRSVTDLRVSQYRPKFKKLLNDDDFKIDITEHTYRRGSVFSPIKDEGPTSILNPIDVGSNTDDDIYKISLDKMQNIYVHQIRVLNEINLDTLPKVFAIVWNLQNPSGSGIMRSDRLFNLNTQRVDITVEPIRNKTSVNNYDTYQKVKSGGFIFERYHYKNNTTDGWTNWFYIAGYTTGLGERPFNSLVNSHNYGSGADAYSTYDTVGVDNPPQIPGYIHLDTFYGIYEEKAYLAWFPAGTYVRRPSDSSNKDVGLPSGAPTIYDAIIRITSTPFISNGAGVKRKRLISHVVQEIFCFPYGFNEGMSYYPYSYKRQGVVGIPTGTSDSGTNLYVEFGSWTS